MKPVGCPPPDLSGTMTASSNRNIFSVTGPLCGESTSHQWIPLTKVSDAELWCFIWCVPEQTIAQTVEMPAILDPMPLIVRSMLWMFCNSWNLSNIFLCVFFFYSLVTVSGCWLPGAYLALGHLQICDDDGCLAHIRNDPAWSSINIYLPSFSNRMAGIIPKQILLQYLHTTIQTYIVKICCNSLKPE